jgi:hypothetical protein
MDTNAKMTKTKQRGRGIYVLQIAQSGVSNFPDEPSPQVWHIFLGKVERFFTSG